MNEDTQDSSYDGKEATERSHQNSIGSTLQKTSMVELM